MVASNRTAISSGHDKTGTLALSVAAVPLFENRKEVWVMSSGT